MVNIVSSGLQSARRLDFQDFVVIPAGPVRLGSDATAVIAVHTDVGRASPRAGACRRCALMRADLVQAGHVFSLASRLSGVLVRPDTDDLG